MISGLTWAAQFLAQPFKSYAQTGQGGPMMPTVGGYSKPANMPYMTAPHPLVKPAGYGPNELGTEGIDRAYYMAFPRGGAGRNPYGDTGRQGRKARVVRVGVQAFDATALRVK